MNWLNRVMALTDGRDLDMALDTIGTTELDQPDHEAYFNTGGVSHVIVRLDDFDLYGSAATVCGFIALHGDSYPKYDLCPECAA